MKRGDIFSAVCTVAVCAILPIASFAEPAPKAGDYKLLPVTNVNRVVEMQCHQYISGTDVNGRRYGLWSPTLRYNDPHCANLPAVAQQPPSNVRRLPAVPRGRPGDSMEYCYSATNTVHFVVYSKVGGKVFDNPFDFQGNQNSQCIPVTTSVRSKKK